MVRKVFNEVGGIFQNIWRIHTPDFKSNTPKDYCDVVEYDNIYF